MRRVNWTANERVDVPDLTAMSGLTESEFRRLLSMGVYGFDTVTVLRGFDVEPESPTTTRVKIRMNKAADAVPLRTESLAIGAENLGSDIDYGVLIGGRSSNGSLEGAAQVLLDFAALPFGVYYVEMRAGTTTGNIENRVFWNPVSNSEYVNNVPTRIQPMWEAQIVPALTNNEWLPLAQVNWTGGTISALDITDIRYLAFEGFAAFGFDAIHQNLAVNDFDRATSRGAFTTTISSVITAINALQRQVLDLKGQSNFGTWNWYSRVFAPDATGEAVWIRQTKSLRSIDVVTYTIGDGQTDYGDFNGPTGLLLCLQHIVAQSSSLPRRIKIVFKNRAISGFAQTFNTPVVISDKDIEITNDTGQGEVTRTSQNGHRVRGQTVIVTTSGAPNTTMLRLDGRCSLKMRNIAWAEPSVEVSQIRVEGPVDLENCSIEGWPIGLGVSALRCHSDQSTIRQCHFSGLVNFGGGDDLIAAYGGNVSHTRFHNAYLRLRTSINTSGLTTLEILQGVAQYVDFEDCQFAGHTGFTTGDNVPHPNGGVIDCRGASNIAFLRCRLDHSCEENGIVLGNLISGVDSFSTNSRVISIEKSEFAWYNDNAHSYLGGVEGAEGTGHHVFNRQSSLTDTTQQTSQITIRDNAFYGGAFGLFGPPDGGAITLLSPRHVCIENNRFTDWNHPAVAGAVFQVFIGGQGVPAALPTDIKFLHNYFGDWAATPTTTSSAAFTDCLHLQVCDNMFSHDARVSPALTVISGAAALWINNCAGFNVDRNRFRSWRSSVSAPSTHCNIRLVNAVVNGTIDNNFFEDYGGYAIDGDLFAIAVKVRFNECLGDPAAMRRVLNFEPTVTADLSVIGNKWNYSGTVRTAVHLGTGLSFILFQNWVNDGDIAHTTLGGGPLAGAFGYGVTYTNYLGGGAYI